jgi:hypothetical protein
MGGHHYGHGLVLESGGIARRPIWTTGAGFVTTNGETDQP